MHVWVCMWACVRLCVCLNEHELFRDNMCASQLGKPKGQKIKMHLKKWEGKHLPKLPSPSLADWPHLLSHTAITRVSLYTPPYFLCARLLVFLPISQACPLVLRIVCRYLHLNENVDSVPHPISYMSRAQKARRTSDCHIKEYRPGIVPALYTLLQKLVSFNIIIIQSSLYVFFLILKVALTI